jgi:hypothetical protein
MASLEAIPAEVQELPTRTWNPNTNWQSAWPNRWVFAISHRKAIISFVDERSGLHLQFTFFLWCVLQMRAALLLREGLR